MKLKNKILTIVSTFAVALGLAVVGHATKVEAADTKTVTVSYDSLDADDNNLFSSSAPSSFTKNTSADGVTVNYKGLYKHSSGYLMFNKNTANLFINVSLNKISKVTLTTSSGTSIKGTLTYCSSEVETTTCSSTKTISINSKSSDFTLDFSEETPVYVGLINASSYNIQFTNIAITYEKTELSLSDKISQEDTLVQLGFGYNVNSQSGEFSVSSKTQITASYSGSNVPVDTNIANDYLDNRYSSLFDVKVISNDASNNGWLTGDGQIRLYGYNSNGNALVINTEATITKVVIKAVGNNASNAALMDVLSNDESVVEEPVELLTATTDDVTIEGLKTNNLVIKNVTSGTYQVRINSLEIYFESDDVAVYSDFNNVKMRFVGSLSEELVAELGDDATYGISITIGEVTLDKVATLDEEDYTWAVVLEGIPTTAYDTEITGQAYVVIDGETVYLSSKTYSVNNLVNHYIENSSKYELTSASLTALAYFVNA